jgi:hypothetical protein
VIEVSVEIPVDEQASSVRVKELMPGQVTHSFETAISIGATDENEKPG